jgi:hypothetical protein
VRTLKHKDSEYGYEIYAIDILRKRLTSLIVGLILRAEAKSSHEEKEKMNFIIAANRVRIPCSVLADDFMKFYIDNRYYIKKWQTAKTLNWHLSKNISVVH